MRRMRRETRRAHPADQGLEGPDCMKLLYLHGIGDRKPDRKWLAALNDSLEESGYPLIPGDQVIAPNYYGLLLMKGLRAKLPDKTYKPPREHEEVRARMDFERRQAD